MPELSYDDISAQFSIVEVLGQGGQKIVFAVEHPEYGACVLKIGVCKSKSALERIKREVETLKSITSDYYPNQFDFVIVDEQRFYILEERIIGKPLSKEITKYHTVTLSTKLIKQITKGLEILWSRNIVHRDIKPDNIIITTSGHPKIIDLGIARLTDLSSLTESLAPLGPCTPNYASPEQLTNRKHEINHRADQFCIGILYAQLLLGGAHPFDPKVVGKGQSIVDNILNGRWAKSHFNTSQLSQVGVVLSRMLDPEPYRRFRTPAALIDSINKII